MKIHCECGHVIHDGTDGLAHKGHVVPDRRWNELADAIDDAVSGGGTPRQREAACMRLRVLLNEMARTAWQCDACGMLYLEDARRRLRAFGPRGEAEARGILRGG